MVFAQLERKMTAERTASIMRDRVERGLWNGGHILGYRSRPQEPGYLEIDEEGAAIVRTIFDSFEKLGSCGAVTREMSEKGIRYQSRLVGSEESQKELLAIRKQLRSEFNFETKASTIESISLANQLGEPLEIAEIELGRLEMK